MLINRLEDVKIIRLLRHDASQNEGFSLLIDQYKERLYWHIRRIVLTHEDADDVLQNVFIKVFKNIDGFKEDSSLYTWLFRIATNESINLINKNKKRSSTGDHSEFISNTLKADPYFDGDFFQAEIKKCIAMLPEKQMIVFNLRYFEEMKYEQMSRVLDTSEGALKSSYHHAVKKIEAYVKKMNIHYEF